MTIREHEKYVGTELYHKITTNRDLYHLLDLRNGFKEVTLSGKEIGRFELVELDKDLFLINGFECMLWHNYEQVIEEITDLVSNDTRIVNTIILTLKKNILELKKRIAKNKHLNFLGSKKAIHEKNLATIDVLISAYKLLIFNVKCVVKEVANTGKQKKFRLKSIARYYRISNNLIDDINCNQVAKKYGWSSGQKLKEHYDRYRNENNRTAVNGGTKKSYSAIITSYEEVIEICQTENNTDALEIAQKEKIIAENNLNQFCP